MLRGASEVHEVPVDHPSLSQGWWAVERNGTVQRRWTNGDAGLPLALPAGSGAAVDVVLCVAATTQYPLLAGERAAA